MIIDWYISQVWIIIALWLCLAGVFLALMVKSDLASWKKTLLIPLTILLVYGTINQNAGLLGQPIRAYPDGVFEIHGYRVDVVSHTESWIILWAIETGETDRLYRFPYDAETEQELAEAQQQQQEGLVQFGEFEVPDDPAGEQDLPNLRLFDPQTPPVFSKNGA